MHKWKLFKKSVALVLSSAVIAVRNAGNSNGIRTEVFSDVSEEKMEETAQEADEEFQPESSEESDVEDIQEEDSKAFHRRVPAGRRNAESGKCRRCVQRWRCVHGRSGRSSSGYV